MASPAKANATTSRNTNDASSFDFSGKILRKKNISAEYIKLAIQEDGREKSTTVYIPRKGPAVCAPSEFNFLYAGANVRVRGCIDGDEAYHHATQCDLVRCAPNAKIIKEMLALPNYPSFASAMGFAGTDEGGEEEFKRLIEEGKSQKVVANRIIEKLTGKREEKVLPRYRPGRIRRSDLDVLERKEAEGRAAEDGGPHNQSPSWSLCQPCRSSNDSPSFIDRRKESVVNLPDGAEESASAHGRLTRSEYLETKKNHQAMWFVERIRQFEKPWPTRFLDVGGGRGDLAVRLVLNFPEARAVVVDSNLRSVNAGREYAADCGVEDRIEFCCMDFSEYSEGYDDAGCSRGPTDECVVALHACGDLSDMALSFASSRRCNFVICPCCYPKRYLAPFIPHWHGFCIGSEVDSLSRLVELDDHRDVSRRAMLVVNSMRKSAFEKQDVVLEEFDDKISKRNIAMVGTC